MGNIIYHEGRCPVNEAWYMYIQYCYELMFLPSNRGHSVEHHNRSLGPHLVSSTLTMLRNSFRDLDHMETPV